MTITQNKEDIFIDWLTYRSYESNRFRNPSIDPEKWKAIYGENQCIEFDKIYNQNLNRIYNLGIGNEKN